MRTEISTPGSAARRSSDENQKNSWTSKSPRIGRNSAFDAASRISSSDVYSSTKHSLLPLSRARVHRQAVHYSSEHSELLSRSFLRTTGGTRAMNSRNAHSSIIDNQSSKPLALPFTPCAVRSLSTDAFAVSHSTSNRSRWRRDLT